MWKDFWNQSSLVAGQVGTPTEKIPPRSFQPLNLRSIFKDNIWFFCPYLIFLFAGGLVIAFLPKAEVHLAINRHHGALADLLFSGVTWLGNGFVVAVICSAFLFVRYRFYFLLVISNVVAALITQALKRFVFQDVARPQRFFEGVSQLHTLDSAASNLFKGFPSGHTAGAFCTCLCLALISRNKGLKLLLFLVALTVGFSRVYLSQHFFNDVYFGSLIGVAVATVVSVSIARSKKLNAARWIDKSLLK